MDAAPHLAEIEPDRLRRLDEAWRPARAAGVVGVSSLEALRWHASGFILDEWRALSAGAFVDCGTGAGVPGVLLALELPHSQWTLVDANERRCEMAKRAVAAAGISGRVEVEHVLVEDMAHKSEFRGMFDGAVARLFGPPAELAECGLPLLRTGGALVVSVSAATRAEWQRLALLARTGCEVDLNWSTPYGSFLSVKRIEPGPLGLPRRRAARRRSALSE